MSLRDRWGAASRLDRTVVITCFVFVGLGVLSRPVWRAVRPRLKVTTHYRSVAATDPWGSAWERPDATRIYSPGANQIYEEGGGDDLLLLPPESPEPYLYGWTPYALILFGFSLGITHRLARGEERTGFADEVGRAVMTAIPLGVYGAALTAVLTIPRGAQPAVIDPISLSSVAAAPTPIVLAGAAYACAVMFVLAVRMAQPPLTVPTDYTYYVGYDAGTPS